MKKLFYALILIGLAGCGAKETLLPDKIKVYQIYEYDGKYGMIEQPPFDGLKGEVKQVVNHIENGGTETYTFHRNGLIDEISTDVFDAESKQNKIDKIKYNYKYKDDILYRTILKNGSKIHEDKTYYRNGLPMLRESNGGTENWNHDNEGRLTSYSRNGKVIFEKKYMLNSAYEGKWIEEYHYMDKPYLRSITNYNDALSSIKTYIIIAAIVATLSSFDIEALEYYRCYYINNWCKSNRIDLKPLIQNDITNVLPHLTPIGIFEQLFITTIPCIKANRYSTMPHTASKERGILFLRILISAICYTLIAVFLFNNAEAYMEKVFWIGNSSNSALAEELKFKFKDIEGWWMLIVSAVLMFVSDRLSHKYWQTVKEFNNDWINEFLPDESDLYKKHIDAVPSNLKNSLH